MGDKVMKRQLFLALGVLSLGLAACTQNAGPLKVDSIEPPQGTTAGGEEITIRGGGFQPGRTQAEVKFGRKKARWSPSPPTARSRWSRLRTRRGHRRQRDV
jgi:hypothetical protein